MLLPLSRRLDEPDSWHHVYNRGASTRPVFLCRADFRYFLACLARVVHVGLIELHAHVLLRTHYHLLIRSLVGRLDEALKLVQNRYSRYFNRKLRRDGGLWHSRYKSKRVLSNAYHSHLVSYIDANAVKAARAASPADYPWGSASLYARSKRPKWLATTWVESEVRLLTGRSAEDRRSLPRRASTLRLTFDPLITSAESTQHQDANVDNFAIDRRAPLAYGQVGKGEHK